MVHRVTPRLSYANVMSTLAVFMILGGGAYAATTIPGPSGVINGCYQKNKGTLRVLVGKQKCQKKSELGISWNNKGVPGRAGTPGTAGTTGTAGTNGTNGVNGANFTDTTTLQPGQTESGIYSNWGGGTGNYMSDGVNFRIPLASAISNSNVGIIYEGGSGTSDCPGPGHATAGHLCIYETDAVNGSLSAIEDPASGGLGAGTAGFMTYYTVGGAGAAYAYGSWSVTAP